jgi:hypothetical protein
MTTAPQTAPAKTDLATQCPEVEIVQQNDPTKHAASLKDTELPVPGSPTWSQWVGMNLHVTIRTVQRWLNPAPPKEEKTERKTKAKQARSIRPFEPLWDWQAAQHKANDLVFAVKRLKAMTPVGTDMLEEPLKELANLLGYKLVK